MHKSLLSVMGEGAFFDGAAVSELVNIEHGVQLTGQDDDLLVNRDIATVESSHVAGEKFVQNGKRYRLEALVQDNGVNKRFIVLEIPLGP